MRGRSNWRLAVPPQRNQSEAGSCRSSSFEKSMFAYLDKVLLGKNKRRSSATARSQKTDGDHTGYGRAIVPHVAGAVLYHAIARFHEYLRAVIQFQPYFP